MYIIIDEIVAVLEVLSLRDAVGGDKHIYFLIEFGIDGSLFFRYRRKKSEDFIEVHFLTCLDCASRFDIAGDKGCVKPGAFLDERRNILIEILSRIGKCCENYDFLVAGIDWVGELRANIVYEQLKFAVMLRCNIFKHEQQCAEIIEVFDEIFTPLHIVHVGKVNLCFLAADKD